ncbi:high frequency lysogenization protein HflD [Ignatzschineria rhizosphaerae]|uniref:High frequency lysogenization protein HflD homolog n=1 Tax=Ignatzschineria rhizosphaerae TaxID=2923279 RepID=A0ABY3X2M8_9GAMM|nr:high frequency lysogenization protein HflD [Ignatzschineria rhizosphaerae]UNM96021.1 high frequency lysogenization protein HflD [Ignatzschineria rhizosphaerae]
MDRNQVIALSAILQSAILVNRLATIGSIPNEERNPLLHSIFAMTPENIQDVYDGVENIKPGLQGFAQGLKNVPSQAKIYFYSLISLEKSLSNDSETLTILASGLESISTRLQHFDMTHENIIAGIADLYTQTLSKLSPRIMVRGDQAVLSQPHITNEIRTLLLAGIRSAMLWRQYGGTKFSLLWPWNKLPETAHQILLEI